MRNVRALFLIVLVFSLHTSAAVEESDSISMHNLLEMHLDELLDLEVVTASKTARSLSEITQKVDVVTSTHIAQTVAGNRNIAEYIQYLPGASVRVLSRNDANWGAYGGIGPKYNTYMVQGLPVDGFIDPQSLDIMAVSRIEVQRGPASILYPNYLSQDFAGNQCPLAGTVNLILKDQVSKPETMVSAAYGSYNTVKGQVYHENSIHGLNLIAGLTVEKSDYSDYGTENSWLGMIDDPGYEKAKVFVNANMALDNASDHTIGLFGNQTLHQGDLGRPHREYRFEYSLMNVHYSGQLRDAVTLQLKTGLRRYDREFEDDNYASEDRDLALKQTSTVSQLILPSDLSVSFTHFKNSNLTVGTDYQHASYLTGTKEPGEPCITGNDADVSQFGTYVQEEVKLNRWIVRGGLRFNRIIYAIDRIGGGKPGLDDESWNVFLWSAGLKYNLNSELSLYGNAGNSFMSPALKSIGGTLPQSDKFIPGRNGQLPNSDLTPEEGFSIDCGFDYHLPMNVSLSSRVFYTVLTDAIIDNDISRDSSHSQTMSVNAAGKTIGRGGEFSVRQQLSDKVDWFANMTYTLSEIENPDDSDGGEVPFVPGLMNNTGITVYFPNAIEVSVWAHFGGMIFDNSSKADRTSYDSGEVINIHAAKTFLLRNNKELTAFFSAYNSTDNTFAMPWQFQDPGFSAMCGAKVVF